MKNIISLAIGLTMMASASQAATVNLVKNGSFEDRDLGNVTYVPTFPGNNDLTHWTVGGQSIDRIRKTWQPSHGNYSIDLDGLSYHTGEVSQLVQSFVIGQAYTLTFDMAGNPGALPTIKTMDVGIGGVFSSFLFDITGKTLTDMGWEQRSRNFVASATELDLVFRSTTSIAAAGWGAALDNVAILASTTPVPLPAPAALLIPPLAGLVLLRRRRKR